MRVMVLGAGVIGTSCAYYLAKAGHEVAVVERRSGPGLETSFANAGGICPGFAGPWAALGMPLKVARWLRSADAPVVVRPRLDPYFWAGSPGFCATVTPSALRATRRACSASRITAKHVSRS
jgi:D-amino-acid dehydrogenase